MSINIGDIVMWRPKSIALRDYWCKVEVESKPRSGVFKGKVIDQKGFEENQGLSYDDWEVRQIHES